MRNGSCFLSSQSQALLVLLPLVNVLFLHQLVAGQGDGNGEDTMARFADPRRCWYNEISEDLLPSPSESVLPENSNVMVGVYYYPWHGDDFHFGEGYLRKSLGQCPLLGEYDDSERSTISHHLAWSRQANIRLWVASWWGPNTRTDNTIDYAIFDHPEIEGDENFKVALFYETTGRVRPVPNERRRHVEEESTENEEEMTLAELVRESRLWASSPIESANMTASDDSSLRGRRHLQEVNGYVLDNLKSDFDYICDQYADKPNYLRIDGKPVVFSYLTRRYLQLGILEDMVQQVRQASCDVYLIGDHTFNAPPSSSDNQGFELLDAVTNYDVYGSFSAGMLGALATPVILNKHYDRQQGWKDLAKEKGVAYVPSVSAGFNDVARRPLLTRPPLARRMLGGQEEGSMFSYSIDKAKELLDCSASNILMVTSFNEWHEDTQIEPVVGASPVSEPPELTFGVDYKAYGDTYLKLLRAGTSGTDQFCELSEEEGDASEDDSSSPQNPTSPLRPPPLDSDALTLTLVGWSPTRRLDQCEGNCYGDSDCRGSLVCFDRENGESVPGCADSSSAPSDASFCVTEEGL